MPVRGAVLAGGPVYAPLAGFERPFEGKAGAVHFLAQAAAVEFDVTVAVVFDLDPVGEITVVVAQDGAVFHHQLRDAQRRGRGKLFLFGGARRFAFGARKIGRSRAHSGTG